MTAIPQVFVSYNRRDRIPVESIVRQLQSNGLAIWFDHWNLVPGDPWQIEIENALRASDVCAVFVGRFGTGPWQHEEMRSAIHRRVTSPGFRVIPAFLPGAPSEPVGLSDFLMAGHGVRFETLDDPEAFRLLIAGLRGVPPGSGSTQPSGVVVYEVVITGSFRDTDKGKVEAIFEHLRKLSQDADLTLKAVREGSLIFIVEGTRKGYDTLRTLFDRGDLNTVLGSSVLDMRVHASDETVPKERLTRAEERIPLSSPDRQTSRTTAEAEESRGAPSRSHARTALDTYLQEAAALATPTNEQPLSADETTDLLYQAQQGDQEALNRLLQRSLPPLRRWARGRLPQAARGYQDADDLVQDAVVESLRRLDRLEARHQGAFQAYLRIAVMNRIRDVVRRRQHKPEEMEIPETLTEDQSSPLERAIGAENLARYERVLSRLKSDDREAIIGRIEMQYRYRELARLLNKPSESAAKMAVTRALKRMADELEKV